MNWFGNDTGHPNVTWVLEWSDVQPEGLTREAIFLKHKMGETYDNVCSPEQSDECVAVHISFSKDYLQDLFEDNSCYVTSAKAEKLMHDEFDKRLTQFDFDLHLVL